MTTTAQPPSDSWDAEPAVMVPSGLNAAGSLASRSAVVPGRMPSSCSRVTSPRRPEPVTGAGRRGEVTLEQDEGIRPGTTAERLARLPAAFSPDGTITAGSASQLSDGGCAVVVMDKDEAQRQGLTWLAEIGGYGTVAGPDPSLLLQPANAIRDAL